MKKCVREWIITAMTSFVCIPSLPSPSRPLIHRKANCRFLNPSAKCIKIRTSCRVDKDEWSAHAIGYTDRDPSSSGDLYPTQQSSTSLPKDAWVLTSVTIGFPDPRLSQFYEGPAKHAENINPNDAAVWALYLKSEELVLKDMKRLDVSLTRPQMGDWI